MSLVKPTPLYPAGYALWLQSRLVSTSRETLATCETCAMVKPTGLTRDAGPFANDLKCCTYFPFLPNFSIGACLNEELSGFKLRLAAAEKSGLFLPHGLFATPEHESLVRSLGKKSFGIRRELLCPFFDVSGNQCGIWAHRPGVCATYFCKSDRGQEGLDSWQMIEGFLNEFEWLLASEVLRRLDLFARCEKYGEMIMLSEGESERQELVRLAWGDWHERKFEFYQQARSTAEQIEPAWLDANLTALLPELSAR